MNRQSMPTTYKSYAQLLKMVINVGLSSFYFGFSLAYFNAINFDDIVQIYQLQGFDRSMTQGWITGCISAAACLGALISTYLINNFSRIQCIMMINFIIFGNTILLMIPHVIVLIVCRLIQGLCIGILSSAAPLFIR